MEQWFITAGGKLQERWRAAFPAAVAAASLEAAAGSGRRILWLDLSAVPPGERVTAVERAVRLGCPVVALVATPTESEAFRSIAAGAYGYCHVKAAPQQLREVAVVVANHGLWMPPELMQRFLKLSLRVMPRELPQPLALNGLTSRELMVAEQVARGASNREIAAALDITERTVKAHLSVIFDKMGVRDRVQLALAMNDIPTYASACSVN